MRFNKVLPVFLLLLLSMLGASCGGSYMSKPPVTPPTGTDALEEHLVRIVDLERASGAVFPNFGVDDLTAGSVRTEAAENNNANNNDNAGNVNVAVTEANAGANYSAFFCPFSSTVAECMTVGAFTTDNLGNAESNAGFPQTGTFAGVFMITRDLQPQFVTGFTLPSRRADNTRNFEVDLQRVALVSGGLGTEFPAAGTDALTSGHVEVNSTNNNQPVEITLAGAAKAATYAIKFCRYGTGVDSCIPLSSITTDALGNASTELAFPATGTFDGVFILARNVDGQVRSEFVTGFQR